MAQDWLVEIARSSSGKTSGHRIRLIKTPLTNMCGLRCSRGITVTRRSQQTLRSWRPSWRVSGLTCPTDQLTVQYCHLFSKGFRYALKQLVNISNTLCKLVLVEATFHFNLRFEQLLFRLISQAYLSSGLNWFALIAICISVDLFLDGLF